MQLSNLIDKLNEFKKEHGESEIYGIYDKYNSVMFPAAKNKNTAWDPDIKDIDLGGDISIDIKVSKL